MSLVKYVPEWMPGAGFKRKAREWRAVAERFYTIPFDSVKKSMKEGTAKGSFTALALRDITEKDDRAYQEELIKGLGGTIYTGACSPFSLPPMIKLTLRHIAGADTVWFHNVRTRSKLIRSSRP